MFGAVIELRPHHRGTVDNLVATLEPDPTVLALLLTGSIAHGFSTDASDVDVVAVLDAPRYTAHAERGELTFLELDVATYEGGFVDGKYVDLAFLRRVAADGSEPARFAYADAEILFSRVDRLDDVLRDVVRYPLAGRDERVARFCAQLRAWQWYFGQGADKDNRYLTTLATQKIVLFLCRIVLARNALLYPYHKWMLRVTESAPDRPSTLMNEIDELLAEPTQDRIDVLCPSVLDHYGIAPMSGSWGDWFLRDNELTWMRGEPSVDDL